MEIFVYSLFWNTIFKKSNIAKRSLKEKLWRQM
jgi:hypothetical protein